MVRQLHVEFVHEPDTKVPAGARPCAGEPDTIQLPDRMRERQLAAARINALTKTETLIGELKGLNPDPKCLAVELEKLLSRYDMDASSALDNRLSAGAG